MPWPRSLDKSDGSGNTVIITALGGDLAPEGQAVSVVLSEMWYV